MDPDIFRITPAPIKTVQFRLTDQSLNAPLIDTEDSPPRFCC